ncbi:hypothetical protein JCM6882_008396 [Rhodosporidiobolus microsporus]
MSHELSVEGDKVIERDERGKVVSEKDYTRVHAGYAAAAHNKNFTDERREASEQIMHDLEVAHGDPPSPSSSKGHHPKPATSSSSKKSHEGEEHHDVGGHDLRRAVSGEGDEAEGVETAEEHAQLVHDHRVIGGLKAALHRDSTSDEGKQHAREKLEAMGIDPDTV